MQRHSARCTVIVLSLLTKIFWNSQLKERKPNHSAKLDTKCLLSAIFFDDIHIYNFLHLVQNIQGVDI